MNRLLRLPSHLNDEFSSVCAFFHTSRGLSRRQNRRPPPVDDSRHYTIRTRNCGPEAGKLDRRADTPAQLRVGARMSRDRDHVTANGRDGNKGDFNRQTAGSRRPDHSIGTKSSVNEWTVQSSGSEGATYTQDLGIQTRRIHKTQTISATHVPRLDPHYASLRDSPTLD